MEKMKKSKRFLSVLLAVVIVLSALPMAGMTAVALNSGDYNYRVISETDKACEITGYTGSATDITIPSDLDGYNVTAIGEMAFAACDLLTYIRLPNGVTSIGPGAFQHCKSLTGIEIPYGVLLIGSSAFFDCISLTDIAIPDSVTAVDYWAFYGCTSLTEVKLSNNMSIIDEELFSDCISLTKIKIPNNVKYICLRAFSNCTSLTSIEIPGSVTSIGDWAFSGCESLTSIIIPDSVTSIRGSAFDNTAYYNNENNWENGVLYIGNHLITGKEDYDFGNLVVKSGTKRISIRAFQGCNTLTDITIPNSVTSIGEYAFENCSGLTDITIPGNILAIEVGTFRNCTGLISVTIQEGVCEIGNYAFAHCKKLSDIQLPDSITAIHNPNPDLYPSGAFCDTAFEKDPKNVIDGVLYIGKVAYWGGASDIIRIREGTLLIADNWYECKNIYIPQSVKNIGDYVYLPYDYYDDFDQPRNVYGYKGTCAEAFAKDRGYTFISLTDFKDKESGVSVTLPYFDSSVENTVLNVKTISLSAEKAIYDISLVQDDVSIQPKGTIIVKIPVSNGVTPELYKVYREETNGRYKKMQASLQDGYMLITTDALGKFILTTEEIKFISGDINNDGIIDAADAIMILRYDAGLIEFTADQLTAADVTGDGIIDAADAIMILRYDAGLITEL